VEQLNFFDCTVVAVWALRWQEQSLAPHWPDGSSHKNRSLAMIKSSIAIAAATAVMLSAGASLAQEPGATTTTTTTWSDTDGTQLSQTWTTNHYAPVAVQTAPTVGMVLPSTVTYYPLPETINVPDRGNYSYSVINNQPVVVERTTHRVVHVWNTAP
jgi:hypothetical protein